MLQEYKIVVYIGDTSNKAGIRLNSYSLLAGIKENEARKAYEVLQSFLRMNNLKGTMELHYPWDTIIHRTKI